MVETARTCPGCGRSLGPLASRCFYCGPQEAPKSPPVPALAESGAAAPAVVAAPEAAPAGLKELEPNTRCPICKNAVPAQVSAKFVCPMCQSKMECLFAAPIKVVQRAPLSQVCTFHPEVQAAARCRTCRKAVCETCAFRARMGVYCPDCATAPDEAGRKSTTTKGIISLACGVVGLLLVGVTFIAAAASDNAKSAELIATLLLNLALVSGLVAVAMGFTSRDPARGRSILGLIGLLIGFLTLGIYALLVIAGSMMGGK